MRHRQAALAALTQLDPAPRTVAAEDDVAARIAAIVAVPRPAESLDRGRSGAPPGPGVVSRHLPRARSLGLAASAAIAVAASLLWVSPSAGAPPIRGVAASIAMPAGADHALVADGGGPTAFP